MTTPAAELIAEALAVRERAYCPHSHFAVGAAVLTVSGEIFGGCNIENASYGLTICAERVAVFHAVAKGAQKITAVVVATAAGSSPCGACRQVLAEFAQTPDVPVWCINTDGETILETTVSKLLPYGFTLPVSV